MTGCLLYRPGNIAARERLRFARAGMMADSPTLFSVMVTHGLFTGCSGFWKSGSEDPNFNLVFLCVLRASARDAFGPALLKIKGQPKADILDTLVEKLAVLRKPVIAFDQKTKRPATACGTIES